MEHSTHSLILRLRNNCCWRTWQNKFSFPSHVDNNSQLRRRSFCKLYGFNARCFDPRRSHKEADKTEKKLLRRLRHYFTSSTFVVEI